MARNRQPRRKQETGRPGNRTLRCERLEDRRLLAAVTVDTVNDVVDFNDGKTSLREAIFATNTVPGADEIRFDFGHAEPATILLKLGELKVSDALTITGPGAELLTIDASGNDPTPTEDKGDGSRVLNIDDGDAASHLDVSVSGVTITGGDAASAGGGVRSREGLRVIGVRLLDNVADGGAGAMEIIASGMAQIILESSTISENRGWGQGGGVFILLSEQAGATISDNSIRGNRTNDTIASGGGLYVRASGLGDITLLRNEFIENETQGNAANGGGVYLGTGGAGRIWIESNVFSRNKTDGTDGEGGGLYIFGGNRDQTIIHNQFLGNSTDGTGASGGGAYVYGSGNVTIFDNAFVKNLTDGTGAGGGGLYASQSGSDNLLIYANEFRENTADGNGADGGGVSVGKSGGGTAQVFDNVVVGNRISGTFSVGLGIYAMASGGGTIQVHSNSVLGNKSITQFQSNGYGGIGAETYESGRILIEDNTVTNNFGGIAASGAGYMEVNDNVVTGNAVIGMALSVNKTGVVQSRRNVIAGNGSEQMRSGGGVSLGVQYGATICFEENLVEGNTAAGQGGAGISAFLRAGGSIQIRSTTVADNHVFPFQYFVYLNDGGGIRVDNRGGDFLLENSTISGNAAVGSGGGIFLGGESEGEFAQRFIIRNSTIASNVADSDNDETGTGGGIHIDSGAVELDHSIVALNTDNSGFAPDIAGALTTARFNLVGDNAGTSLPEAPVQTPDANGNLIGGSVHGVIDPRLGPLEGNGGTVPTRALLPGSPAIDRGDATLEPGIGGAPEFDQRGAPFTRLAGSRIDIGAFEVQPAGGALSADFNFDGVADGKDLLAWQRGLGRTSPTIRHGDATADGDVDARDLDVWRARFGQTTFRSHDSGARTASAANGSDGREISPETLVAAQQAILDRGAFLTDLAMTTYSTYLTESSGRSAPMAEQVHFETEGFKRSTLRRSVSGGSYAFGAPEGFNSETGNRAFIFEPIAVLRDMALCWALDEALTESFSAP